MDNADRETDAKNRHSQNTMCPPPEHETVFSIHAADQLAEQWLVSVL